jgi:DNA-binding Lrp family transcriptional regulator
LRSLQVNVVKAGRKIICKERDVFPEMPQAIVLINADIGKENEILQDLCKIAEVERALLVYGVYDLVANLEAETMEKLEDAITLKIRRIAGIRSTLTLIVSRQCK